MSHRDIRYNETICIQRKFSSSFKFVSFLWKSDSFPFLLGNRSNSSVLMKFYGHSFRTFREMRKSCATTTSPSVTICFWSHKVPQVINEFMCRALGGVKKTAQKMNSITTIKSTLDVPESWTNSIFFSFWWHELFSNFMKGHRSFSNIKTKQNSTCRKCFEQFSPLKTTWEGNSKFQNDLCIQ